MSSRPFATLVVGLAILLSLPGPARAAEKAPFPVGSDVVTLTRDGQKVGPLDKLRVKGKYTVFDVYADWCGPCRLVEHYLRDVLETRRDVAVRRLNVVSFDTPLARELGSDFDGLPYLVVFDPDGKRTDIVGFDEETLGDALRP